MKKVMSIIGLVTFVLIIGMIIYNVHQKYLRQKNNMNDTYVSEDYKIEWKYEGVELQIRIELDKFNSDIYLSDVSEISYLTLRGKDIYSLEDLSAFKNLKSLTLEDTAVKDLSPLTELHRLSELIIIEGEQITIDALTVLPEIKSLGIHSSDINNIMAVRTLKNLTDFYIRSSTVNDISALADLKKLKTVVISDCPVNDISALKKINLYELWLEGTDVHLVPELSKSIESLNLEDNQIDDISSLKGLKNLKILRLNNNKIDNIEPLRDLKKLAILEIQNNSVKNIEPISSLPELETLDLFGNPIEDFSCIKLPALRYLSLSGEVMGEDLDFLSKSRELYSLSIVDTNLSKIIKPIPVLPFLKNVTINRCQLKSLDIFINLANLESLDVRDNEIDDITALNDRKYPSFLALKGNKITLGDLPEKWRNSIQIRIDIVAEENPKFTMPEDITISETQSE